MNLLSFHKIIALVNLLLGSSLLAVILLLAIFRQAGAHEMFVYLSTAALLLAMGFSTWSRRRRLTSVLALPLILAGLWGLLFMQVGGWAWGESNRGTVVLIEFSAVLLLVLALVSILAAGRKASPEENKKNR